MKHDHEWYLQLGRQAAELLGAAIFAVPSPRHPPEMERKYLSELSQKTQRLCEFILDVDAQDIDNEVDDD